MAEPFIGQIDIFAFNFVPQDWAQCDGGLLNINDNQALFALLGTAFGGNGRTTFGLPDFRGKIPVGMGNNPGSPYDYRVGNTRGAETHIMTVPELPTHAHTMSVTTNPLFAVASFPDAFTGTIKGTGNTADSNGPKNKYPATTDSTLKRYSNSLTEKPMATDGVDIDISNVNVSVTDAYQTYAGVAGSTGTNTQFNLIQSSLVLNYCIALKGLFPSRN